VLPNAIAPVLVSATFGVAGAILTESRLSFLGLGISVPTPSWGGMLTSGRDAIFRAPWLIWHPGLAIFVTISCYNLVGEALRDASDPRLRGSRWCIVNAESWGATGGLSASVHGLRRQQPENQGLREH